VPTREEFLADTIQATTTTITNGDTAFSSFLKLSKAGWGKELFLNKVGEFGNYWTRSYNVSAFFMAFSGSTATVYSGLYDDVLFSVRCIKN
jgi:hypothetical protein